jgi:hypothetical protein
LLLSCHEITEDFFAVEEAEILQVIFAVEEA